MSSKINTVFLSESDYSSWNNFVAKSSFGSIYSTPEYLDILCSVTDAKFKILAAKQGDEIVGGIGLYERSSAEGKYVSPRQLIYYNGIILRNYDTKYPSQATSRHLAILSSLEEALSVEKYSALRFRNQSAFYDARVFLANDWRVQLYYSYTVDISQMNMQWEKVDPNLQRLINRCERDNFKIIQDNDFERFYELRLKTNERKGSPLYLSYENYKKYYDRLRELGLCSLYHACTSTGEIVSSQLVLLGSHPVTHTISAATDEAFLSSGVSAFLRWKVFEDLSKQGYKTNDLTDAALNPVTRFKSQFGGDLKVCMELIKKRDTGSSTHQSLAKMVKKKVKNLLR